jgi:hypothetical protein
MLQLFGLCTLKPILTKMRWSRLAIRWVKRDYSPLSSVTAMQEELGWQSLEHCRLDCKLIMFYKVYHNLVAINLPPYVQAPHRIIRHMHPLSLCQIQVSSDYHKYSFFPHSIILHVLYGINSLVPLPPSPTWVSSNRQWWVCSTSLTPSVFKLFYLLSSFFTINILTMTRIHFQCLHPSMFIMLGLFFFFSCQLTYIALWDQQFLFKFKLIILNKRALYAWSIACPSIVL